MGVLLKSIILNKISGFSGGINLSSMAEETLMANVKDLCGKYKNDFLLNDVHQGN